MLCHTLELHEVVEKQLSRETRGSFATRFSEQWRVNIACQWNNLPYSEAGRTALRDFVISSRLTDYSWLNVLVDVLQLGPCTGRLLSKCDDAFRILDDEERKLIAQKKKSSKRRYSSK